ncbi:MAG: polysulfide reductase NrfD [Deltaproteobacteria bacterium]|nr:polysulfide reductase NrfD [Deltaproteobacteria bacterium]MBW2393458.1 polysulfide reductase NrfD [Deltaproteobacteria bacterium]
MKVYLAEFWHFSKESLALVTRGSHGYMAWLALLVMMILGGAWAYSNQLSFGLVTSNMRDPVSWGFYIGNFAFLVGVAAAAVILIIPAYIYNWGPIREVALLGELLAISAIIMCMLFVTIDIGRPEMVWHMMPGVGTPNFPYSLLVWDVFVLSAYFVLNFFVATYLVFMSYTGRKYNPAFIMPIIFLSIPLAISIHTVTAFLFMGLKARPFWNEAILAPRFLASAFCSGPALLVLIFQVLRKVRPIQISDAALRKIGELLAYAMAINLFLLGCEVFKEFYSHSHHIIHAQFQWFSLEGGYGIAGYSLFALTCNVTAFVIFIVPAFRNRIPVLLCGCVLAVAGVYVEKGLGLLLPGLTPDVIGEVYRYTPSLNELMVGAGIWGVGLLSFTFMAKISIAITLGEFGYRRT